MMSKSHIMTTFVRVLLMKYMHNSFLQNGDAQELDIGSSTDDDDDNVPASKNKKHKSPKAEADEDSSESDSSEMDSDEERITAANMEARARALDAQAELDAELDAEELRQLAEEHDSELDVEGADEGEGDDEDEFVLPTAEERDSERKSGAQDLVAVQHRMRQCARVLSNFKRLGAKGRQVRLFRLSVYKD